MSFANIYYKRAVATAKACYVCYRPTTTVLATLNTVDFLYACPGHLTDIHFASRIPDEMDKAGSPVSAEEIEKVKKEWEEKQKKKAENEKAAAAEKEKADDKGKASSKVDSPSPPVSPPAPTTPKTTHERYSLHRDFYAMRLQEHKKRRQASQAKELAPRLPGAPSGPVSENKY